MNEKKKYGDKWAWLNQNDNVILGASMFKAIEGDEAKERFEEMSRIRISLARKLWNISCCELNGFNQTAYLDEWVALVPANVLFDSFNKSPVQSQFPQSGPSNSCLPGDNCPERTQRMVGRQINGRNTWAVELQRIIAVLVNCHHDHRFLCMDND